MGERARSQERVRFLHGPLDYPWVYSWGNNEVSAAMRRLLRWLFAPRPLSATYCFSQTASYYFGESEEVCDQEGCWYDEDGKLHCHWEARCDL